MPSKRASPNNNNCSSSSCSNSTDQVVLCMNRHRVSFLYLSGNDIDKETDKPSSSNQRPRTTVICYQPMNLRTILPVHNNVSSCSHLY